MLPRAFPGIIVVFASLLHNNAYAQRRELGPTEWRTFEVREFGTRVQFPASIFAPAGNPNEGAVSDLNVLMDVC
jgi:hypothetical protein